MSPPNGQIMVPASDVEISQIALIEAMRMSNDKIDRLAHVVEKMDDKFDVIVQDLTTLKAQNYRREIDVISTKQAATDSRMTDLLAASLEDRKKLWLAVEARKAEIVNLRDRVLPILALGTTITAAVVAFAVKQVMG